MDQNVVDMVGKVFDAGQAYVAFSPVKTLKGLFLKNLKPYNIKVNVDVVSEMKQLSSQSLPIEPVPNVLSLPSNNWTKIGHINIHSYLAKWKDIITDQAMRQTNIMCFTKTFLKPCQQIQRNFLPLDRLQTNNEDLAKGGIMIVCSRSLQPIRINLQHPPQLEVVSIMATSSCGGRMCIMAIYRHPNQPLMSFLPLLNDYISADNAYHLSWRFQ